MQSFAKDWVNIDSDLFLNFYVKSEANKSSKSAYLSTDAQLFAASSLLLFWKGAVPSSS